jgi:hypothetical protein
MNNKILTHYTKDIEKLVSILNFGFYYSFHPTRTFEQLFEDAKIDALEPDDHAMVCFTELDVDNAAKHRSKFGNFGIAVSMDWAIRAGAKKVEYVKRGNPRYTELLQKIKSSVPVMPFGFPADEQKMPMFEKTLRQLLLGSPAAAKFFGAGDGYEEVLKELLWIQTEAHSEQIEWRIRNPFSSSGTQHRKPTDRDKKYGRINTNNPIYDRSQMISIMSKNEALREMFFLGVDVDEIKFLIVPTGTKELLKQKIDSVLFGQISIIEV